MAVAATAEAEQTSTVAVTPAPVAKASRRARRRARARRSRRVERVVRRVEPWSVAKISFLLCVVVSAVLLVAGALLWRLAVSTDTIDNLESFIQELFALETFELDGQQIFRAAAVSSVLVVLAGTATAVVGAVLFNLLSDLVGGVRFVVIEEEELAPAPSRPARTTPAPTVAGDGTETPPPADDSAEQQRSGQDGSERAGPGIRAAPENGAGEDGATEPLPVRRAAGGSG